MTLHGSALRGGVKLATLLPAETIQDLSGLDQDASVNCALRLIPGASPLITLLRVLVLKTVSVY